MSGRRAGKTTICNLIARFYDVNAGTVSVGTVDVRRMTCDSLLSNISMVFQKVYLFYDTVENNIRFGNPAATHEEIVEAAKKPDAMISLNSFRMDITRSWRRRFNPFWRREAAYFHCQGYLKKCVYCYLGRGYGKYRPGK